MKSCSKALSLGWFVTWQEIRGTLVHLERKPGSGAQQQLGSSLVPLLDPGTEWVMRGKAQLRGTWGEPHLCSGRLGVKRLLKIWIIH